MHVRRSGIRSIRRATLWAFSNFGFGSSARTFVSVRCLVMSCAAFRVLFIRFATSLLGFSAELSMSGAGRVPRPCASAYASNEPTHSPKYQCRQHTT